MASDLILSAVSDVLEKVIYPSVTRNLMEKAPAMQLFFGWKLNQEHEYEMTRKNAMTVKFENNQVYFTILVDSNPSAVGIADDESLRSGKGTTAQGSLAIATETASTKITKQTLNIKNRGSIVNIIEFESTNLVNATALDLNRQVYGDSITTNGSGSSTKTIALTASTNGDIDYAEYFPVGTYVMIAGGTPTKVTARATNSLTVADNQTYNATSSVTKSTGSNTAATEMTGLQVMVDNAQNYASINYSTYPAWNAAVKDAVGGSEALKKIHVDYFKTNRLGNVEYLIVNQTNFANYGNTVFPQVRFASKDVLTGGWKGLDYMAGAATVLLDYMCTDDRIYMLTPKNLIGFEFQPFEFEKGTDGNLLRIAGTISYEMASSWMGQIGTFLRKSHGVQTGVTAITAT